MKILLTINQPYPPPITGANKASKLVLEGLANKGHQVVAVVPARVTALDHSEHESVDVDDRDRSLTVAPFDDAAEIGVLNGVEVHRVTQPAQLRSYLAELIQRFRPDRIIVSSEDPSQNLLDISLRTAKSRVIYWAQTPMFLPFGPHAFFPSATRTRLLHDVPTIMATSKFVADYLATWGSLRSDVLYAPTFGTGPFPQLGHFGNPFITMVNPCQLKGISIFLALARGLPQLRFAAVPTWGTTSVDMVALRNLSNVHLLEPHSDFDEILSLTRVLLMPSLGAEAFGMTATEAKLRGVPVIASDVGGLREAMVGTDYLLPVHSIERFSEQLDDRQVPIPVVPSQEIQSWESTLMQLVENRDVYERQSAEGRHASIEFVTDNGIDRFEDYIVRLVPRETVIVDATDAHERGQGIRTSELADETDSSERLARLSPERKALMMLKLRSVTDTQQAASQR